jgi:hypothetical protein
MSFQQIILTIAIILLIIILVIIGIALSKASDSEIWPPVVGECPDYWVDLSGNGGACVNTHSLGRCNIPSSGEQAAMNFDQAPFNTENGSCAKYTWATGCQVTWDGITSGVPNPCNTTNTTS